MKLAWCKKKMKENDKIKKREKRASVQLTVDKLAERRRKDREWQRKCREKARLIKPTKTNMPFKTKNSKSKAINRVKKDLPSKHKNTAEVVKELFKPLSPKSQQQIKSPEKCQFQCTA